VFLFYLGGGVDAGGTSLFLLFSPSFMDGSFSVKRGMSRGIDAEKTSLFDNSPPHLEDFSASYAAFLPQLFVVMDPPCVPPLFSPTWSLFPLCYDAFQFFYSVRRDYYSYRRPSTTFTPGSPLLQPSFLRICTRGIQACRQKAGILASLGVPFSLVTWCSSTTRPLDP